MDKIDFICSVLKDPEIDESFKSCLSAVYVKNHYCPNFVSKRIILYPGDSMFNAKFQFLQSLMFGWTTARNTGAIYDLSHYQKYKKIVNKIHLLDKIESLSK